MATAKEAITAYIAAQTEINNQQDAAVDGITADVQYQADLIAKLQATQDTWTPEDQATLDALQARNSASLQKLQALDALTNPPPPVV